MRLDRRRGAQARRLARVLNLHFNEAFGWWVAIIEDVDKWADPGPMYTPGGPAADYPLPVIEKPLDAELNADWEGEPGVLIEAMCTAGFLERREDGAVAVLEYWETYAGAHVWNRLKQRYHRATASQKKRLSDCNVTVASRLRNTNTDTDTDANTDTDTNADTDTDTDAGSVSESVSAVGVLAHTSPESVPKKEGTAFEVEAVQAGAVAAAVLGGLTHTVNQTAAEKRAALVRRIMGLTREPPEYADWWEDVIKSTAKINSMDVLLDACRYAAMCADPAQRETKGLGELHSPGAYIAGKCRDVLKSHGMSLPPPPKTPAAPVGEYENDCPF